MNTKTNNLPIFFKLLLTLFICVCLNFCSENEYYEVKTYHSLSKPFTDTLFFPIKSEDVIITSIEMEISGYVDGEAILEIENGAGTYNKLKLRGELDEKYYTEWYENKFEIKYTPISIVNGDSIKLKYRLR